MMMLKLMISYAIPDIPSWVETEMAKIEFHRREIEKASSFAFLQSNQDLLRFGLPSIAKYLDKEIQVYLYLQIIFYFEKKLLFKLFNSI